MISYDDVMRMAAEKHQALKETVWRLISVDSEDSITVEHVCGQDYEISPSDRLMDDLNELVEFHGKELNLDGVDWKLADKLDRECKEIFYTCEWCGR